jgi:DNA (cytosine-5)-methyltransferase 1
METVAFCEFDPHARAILKKHWPDIPIHEDVRELDGNEYRGSVDVVCGGFPCQDLSTAGVGKGFSGERSSLYTEMLRIISQCLPRYSIFENVTGLLTGDRGRWFAKFLYDLASVGYDAEWHCIRACSVGLDHRRDRVWIVAYPEGSRRESIFIKSELFQEAREYSAGFASGNRTFNCPHTGRILRETKSGLDRVADGISRRVDRIKRIGNAVVPDITEVIGRAILNADH